MRDPEPDSHRTRFAESNGDTPPFDLERAQLRRLAAEYTALAQPNPEDARAEAVWNEYWAMLDGMIDAGLKKPLPDEEVIAPIEVWSDKYKAFVHEYEFAHNPRYRRAARVDQILSRFFGLFSRE